MTSITVPFLDLRRSSSRFVHSPQQVLSRILDQGMYILGPELEALEREFAEALGAGFAAGVGSGTDALILALEGSAAITPGAGEEIITSALSAAFTPLAIYRAGAIPRFVDIDLATLQIDSALIESCIGPKTRAIMPVHLYGHACEIFPILELARKYDLEVIEDACQAHGSRLAGKALGTFARAGAFSFYPTKNLGAFGDGGMVVADDPELIRRVRMLRHGGQERSYHHELLGCCSRLDEFQSAILRMKLQSLEESNDVRRKLADRYDEAFRDLGLILLPRRPDFVPNRHLYPIRTPRRNALRRFLLEHGIQTLIHYPTALPGQPAFQPFVLPGQEFPSSQRAANEILSLPLYPELREEELEYTILTVRRFFET
jgi:dTDP-4-amino-4,6-dideoxygalactose transaminase